MKSHKILFILILLLSVSALNAQEMSSARSVALGSAYTGLANGVDAARYNPANLGFQSHRRNAVELVGVGANLNNNSFTLNDYNTYTGAYLTSADKDDILSKIPQEGLKLSFEAEASALSVSMGQFVFGTSVNGIADINMNKDIMELILNGNVFADTINLNGSYSEGLAYGAAYLSFGQALITNGERQLSVGSTVKYLYGIGIEEVIEMEGMAATYAAGFEGEGSVIARTASGGSGYAVDIGAALKLNKSYTVGARIKNFISNMTWDKDTEEHGYIFNFDTMTIDNANEDYITSEDYSIPIPSFDTKLPSVMNVGIAKTSGTLLWAVDWEQGFNSNTGSSTKPRLSAGAEWNALSMMPLRAGFSTGGNQNSSFSFGSGFHFPVFHIDYAVVTGNSLSGYSSKGAHFALTASLNF